MQVVQFIFIYSGYCDTRRSKSLVHTHFPSPLPEAKDLGSVGYTRELSSLRPSARVTHRTLAVVGLVWFGWVQCVFEVMFIVKVGALSCKNDMRLIYTYSLGSTGVSIEQSHGLEVGKSEQTGRGRDDAHERRHHVGSVGERTKFDQ